MTEVYVSNLAFDTSTNSPVIILKAPNTNKILPIWIGLNEASAIALELSNVVYKRPLTHDLMKSILTGFNAILQKVVISSLQDNTFYAKFYILASENSVIEIDARPSDSIAMALKMKAPIYISDEIENSMSELSNNIVDTDPESENDEESMLKRRLRNFNPEDFDSLDL